MNQSRPVRAVIIPADPAQPVTVEVIDASVAGLCDSVGGQPEPVLLGDTSALLFCNEYGKGMRLAPNGRATRFVNQYVRGFARNDMIVGPAVIVGVADDGGRADVPETVAETARTLCGARPGLRAA